MPNEKRFVDLKVVIMVKIIKENGKEETGGVIAEGNE